MTSASGGAIIGDQMSAQVRVLPNDKPYGTVSLQLESFPVSEDPNGDRQYNIPVIRRCVTKLIIIVFTLLLCIVL